MKKEKWVGVLGGSFNPPHLGHLLASVYALAIFELDEVWLVPTFQHPFQKKLAPFRHRVAMCRRLIQGLGSKFKISTIEGDQKLDGKTLKTLLALRQKHKHHHFSLIIGSDLLKERKKWHRFSEIENRFGVLVVPRGKGKKGEIAIPNISSSEVRKRIKKRKALDLLLTPAVVSYESNHQVYTK